MKDRPKYSEARQQGFDAVESAQGVSWSWSKSYDTGEKKQDESWPTWPDWLSGKNTSIEPECVSKFPAEDRIQATALWMSFQSQALVLSNCAVTPSHQSHSTAFTSGFLQTTMITRAGKTSSIAAGLMLKLTCPRVAVYYYWQVDIVVSSTEKEGIRCGFQNQKGLKFSNLEEKGIPQNESKSGAFIKTLHEELDKMLEGKGSICKAINDSLNSTGRFQHPACGEFNFMDPMFNYRGDILTAARYKAQVLFLEVIKMHDN